MPAATTDMLQALLVKIITITQVLRCAPHASRAAKEIIAPSYALPLDAHLDLAAAEFAECLRH